MISIFQIYFDEKSYEFMDPDFYPFENKLQDDFFENSVIRKIHEMDSDLKQKIDYLGVTSWKFTSRTNLTGKEIIDFIQKDIYSGNAKDAYIYCPLPLEVEYDLSCDPAVLHGTIKAPDMWNQHKQWGKRPYDADKLLNDAQVLPFDLFDGKWVFCHNNYFIAKTAIFDEYCKTVLIPFMEFFKLKDIKKHVASLPWYRHASGNKLYPSYSHVSEGLFGAFLAHNAYTYSYICKKKIRNKFEMIKVDGYEINNQ